jgi:hypothetical protein
MFNDKLYNLHSLPNIRVINSVRTGWAGHAERIGDETCIHNFLCVNLKTSWKT